MRLCIGLHNTFSLWCEEKPPLLLFSKYILNFWWEEVHDSVGIASIFGDTVRQMRLCLGLHSNVRRSCPFSCSPNSRYAGAVYWLLKFLWLEVSYGVGDYLNFWQEKANLVRDWKNTKKAIPILVRGLPELVWVGICQNSKLGSPQTSSGFIPIWGPTTSTVEQVKQHDF